MTENDRKKQYTPEQRARRVAATQKWRLAHPAFKQRKVPAAELPEVALERRRAYAREWTKKNRARISELARRPEQLERRREYAKRWRAKNPDLFKNVHLKRMYGLSIDEHTRMVQDRGNLCDICRQPPSGVGKNAVLHVDHDHAKSGRESVRGMLCNWCNAGLGHFRDSIDVMRAAIGYLEQHGNTEPRDHDQDKGASP